MNDQFCLPFWHDSERVRWPVDPFGVTSVGHSAPATMDATRWFSFEHRREFYFVDVVETGEPPLRIGRRLEFGLCSRTKARRRRSKMRQEAERHAREEVEPKSGSNIDYTKSMTLRVPSSATEDPPVTMGRTNTSSDCPTR
ncbi:MAG: hypothetical protein IV100_35220 [Myxococcales bacterium]|nr:hypothetical protein [Myxococcales bacterium]